MIETTMQMEQADLMIAIFGAFDENIKLIERELGVSVVSRATELKISGDPEAVGVAERVFAALLEMARRGEAVSTQTVQYVIGLAREGRESEVHTMGRDVLVITAKGYGKRTPCSEYREQARNGKGIRAMATREEDYVETLFTASTHDRIFFFTSFGRVYRKKGYQIPEAGRAARGTNIVNILPVEPGEKVSAMLHVREFGDMYIFMVTRSGTVKRLPLDAIKNIRKTGIRALSIAEDDELITVRLTDGKQNILIATHEGYAICFDENDVRPMGREAAGVRGIKLREGDYVVGAGRAGGGTALLSVTENGYGKRTELDEYLRGADGERQPQSRGGMGLKNYNCTEKTGFVADVKVVREDDDLRPEDEDLYSSSYIS